MSTKHLTFLALCIKKGWRVSQPPAIEAILRDLRKIVVDSQGNMILESPNHRILLFECSGVFDVKGGYLHEYIAPCDMKIIKEHFLNQRDTVRFEYVYSLDWAYLKRKYWELGFIKDESFQLEELPTEEL